MKKVGLIIHSESSQGGIDQYSKSMVDAAKKSNTYKYILFTNQEDRRFDNEEIEVRKFIRRKDNFFRKISKKLSLIYKKLGRFYLSSREREKFNDIDLFICPTTSLYPHYFLDKPFLFTLHDLQERYFPKFFSISERLKRYIIKKNLSITSAGIICESNSVKNDIINFFGLPEEKIHVVQAPPPQKFLNYNFEKKTFAKVRSKYHLENNYLYYPAHTWYHKNHLRLIEAFNLITKKFDQIDLVLSGAPKNNFPNIKEKISELGLENRVHYLGYVDYGDLPYLYKMSEMLVMPTLFESISIPIYEAFALKVPVCCSNVTGLPEQVDDAALIFDPFNIDDIVKKIEELLNDKQKVSEIVNKGYEKITNLSHSDYSDRLDYLLNRVFK